MNVRIARVVSWAGLWVCAGFVVAPAGCGSSQELVSIPAPSTVERGEMPALVVEELTECAREGAGRLGAKEHSVRFDVQVTSTGRVETVTLGESTLGDPGVEACMVRVLQAAWLPAQAVTMQPSGAAPAGRMAPESRALFGQAEAIPVGPACFVSPPCVLVAVV